MHVLLNAIPPRGRVRSGWFGLGGFWRLTADGYEGLWSVSASLKVDVRTLVECCPSELGVTDDKTPLEILTAIFTPRAGQRVAYPMIVFARYVSRLT